MTKALLELDIAQCISLVLINMDYLQGNIVQVVTQGLAVTAVTIHIIVLIAVMCKTRF